MAEMRAAMPGEPCTAKVVETAEMSAVDVAAEMSAEATAEVSATVATEMSSTASRESAARQHGCQQDNSHSDHRPRHWHPRRAVLFRKP